ncbi:MAG TPA: hypothetical protein VK674_07635 [Candidatus Limnocylindria bacterium]|nr:hypothetical protein [Candidatus Limnocylindria bacterium]
MGIIGPKVKALLVVGAIGLAENQGDFQIQIPEAGQHPQLPGYAIKDGSELAAARQWVEEFGNPSLYAQSGDLPATPRPELDRIVAGLQALPEVLCPDDTINELRADEYGVCVNIRSITAQTTPSGSWLQAQVTLAPAPGSDSLPLDVPAALSLPEMGEACQEAINVGREIAAEAIQGIYPAAYETTKPFLQMSAGGATCDEPPPTFLSQ